MVTTSEQPVGAGSGESPPSYEPMSVRTPALIVLGLAVVILLGGVVAGALTTGSTPSFGVKYVVLSDGTRVPVSPATDRLHAIEANGEPPADVLGNLGVLTSSTVTGVLNSDQNAGPVRPDRPPHQPARPGPGGRGLPTPAEAPGWNVIYDGPAPQGAAGTTEVLAKHGSGDGFYWEVGVVGLPHHADRVHRRTRSRCSRPPTATDRRPSRRRSDRPRRRRGRPSRGTSTPTRTG